MLRLLKYNFLQILQEKMLLFWMLAFPLVVSLLFHLAFGGWMNTGQTELIPAAYTGTDETFGLYLKQLDKKVIKLKVLDEKKAVEALQNDEVQGIYYTEGEKIHLAVNASGLEESILSMLADAYSKNQQVIQEVSRSHSGNMGAVVEALGQEGHFIKEVSLTGRKFHTMEGYFFALIAMTCLYGGILGRKSMIEMQANLSALGARNSISPTSRMKLILAKMITNVLATFVCVLLVVAFMAFVSGDIHIGGEEGTVMIICLMGSAIGVAMGILIGGTGKWSEETKGMIQILLSILLTFLAGLVIGDIRYVIRENVPLLDRVNPAAVIADAFYCICIYGDKTRLFQDLLILGGMTVLLLTAAVLGARRACYDSL